MCVLVYVCNELSMGEGHGDHWNGPWMCMVDNGSQEIRVFDTCPYSHKIAQCAGSEAYEGVSGVSIFEYSGRSFSAGLIDQIYVPTSVEIGFIHTFVNSKHYVFV